MSGSAILGIALAALAALLNAVALYLLRLHWSEIMRLRDASSDYGKELENHEGRLQRLEE